MSLVPSSFPVESAVASLESVDNLRAKKLTEAEVRAIRASTDKRAWLALTYGVSEQTIWAIKTRRTWGDLK